MCIQWTCVLYSVVITWQSYRPISQFNSPCTEFKSVWSMFVYNNQKHATNKTATTHFILYNGVFLERNQTVLVFLYTLHLVYLYHTINSPENTLISGISCSFRFSNLWDVSNFLTKFVLMATFTTSDMTPLMPFFNLSTSVLLLGLSPGVSILITMASFLNVILYLTFKLPGLWIAKWIS